MNLQIYSLEFNETWRRNSWNDVEEIWKVSARFDKVWGLESLGRPGEKIGRPTTYSVERPSGNFDRSHDFEVLGRSMT